MFLEMIHLRIKENGKNIVYDWVKIKKQRY